MVQVSDSNQGEALVIQAPELTAGINGPKSLTIERDRVDLESVSDSDPSKLIQEVGFRSKGDLINSDYFYDRIQEKFPDAFRIGSEYTEKKYIEKLLDEELGRRIIYDDVVSTTQQMNDWYANAESLVSEFDLEIGEPLTDDMQANLTKDVLWMELVNVDGRQVMVPRLYLSKETKDRLAKEGVAPVHLQTLLL